jgi:hypothetical protein
VVGRRYLLRFGMQMSGFPCSHPITSLVKNLRKKC